MSVRSRRSPQRGGVLAILVLACLVVVVPRLVEGFDQAGAASSLDSVRFEFEDGRVFGGASVATSGDGWSGGGYVTGLDGPSDVASVVIPADRSGRHMTMVSYANGTGSELKMSVSVRDRGIGEIGFAPTGGWNSWRQVAIPMDLEKGDNEVSLTAIRGGVALDFLWTTVELDNGPLNSEIEWSGLDLEIARVAQIPDAADGEPAKISSIVPQGSSIFVTDITGGRVHEVSSLGSGSAQVDLWFDVAAAIPVATGRDLHTDDPVHSGLRSIAFHPEFNTNGLFYTAVIEDRPANPGAHTYMRQSPRPEPFDGVVVEWRFDAQQGRVLTDSYREVFRLGLGAELNPLRQIAFNPHATPATPDYGLLYVGAHGKILRVDPRPSGNRPYGVPGINPFLADDNVLDEAYAAGFRNPHSLTFAREGGRTHLLVSDVGPENVDEINMVVAGADYGWPRHEGTLNHHPDRGLYLGVTPLTADQHRRDDRFPEVQYGHTGDPGDGFVGQALVGGHHVSNGSALDGQFFYADFAESGRVFHSSLAAMVGATTTLQDGQSPTELSQAVIRRPNLFFDHDADPATPLVPRQSMTDIVDDGPNYDGSGRADVRFGSGPDGEAYLSSKRDGGVYVVLNSRPDRGATPKVDDPTPEGGAGEPIEPADDQADPAQALPGAEAAPGAPGGGGLSAPEELRSSEDGAGVQLAWKPAAGARRYLIHRDNRYVTYVTSPTWTDLSPVAGADHRYEVRSQTEDGKNSLPALKVHSVGEGVGAPTGLEADGADGRVRLSWDAGQDSVGHIVHRDGRYLAWVRRGTSEWVDTNPVVGTTHSYRVRAQDGAGANSAPASVEFVVRAEARQPAGLEATRWVRVEVVDATVRVDWAPVEGAAGYLVHRDSQYLGWVPDGTAWIDAAPVEGRSHRYEIRAQDDGGSNSAPAEGISVPM